MRKTTLNLKRATFFKRILAFLLAQVIIIAAFIYLVTADMPVDSQSIIKATVVVEEVEYDYTFIGHGIFKFFSDSIEYDFPKIPVEYSMYELYETITTGDEIVVEYIEQDNCNLVIGASKDESVLRSIDAYNDFAKTQQRMCVITFVIVELIFTAILTGFVLFYYKELKLFRRKKA